MKEINKLATFNVFYLKLLFRGSEVHQVLQAGRGNHLCVPHKAHLLIKQENEQDRSINRYWSRGQN